MGPKEKFFFTKIFPIPFILIGLVTLYMGVKDLGKAAESAQWPSVEGTILHSSLDVHHGDDSTTYSAEVMYTYEVEGTVYSSNRLKFGYARTGNPSDAQKIVNSYPIDSQVIVYFDPAQPEESVLVPGRTASAYFLPGFGLVFLCSGLAVLILLPRAFRPKELKKKEKAFPPLRMDYDN